MKVTSWLALIYVGLLSSEALAELTCPDDAAAEPNRPMAVSGKPDGVEEVPVLYESQALTASAPSPFDDFGLEGSIDGDTLAVGKAPPGAAAQAYPLVEIYEFGDGQWTFVKQISPPGQGPLDFPAVTSLDGDTLAVGDPTYCETAGQCRSGTAYLFERNAGGADNWGFTRKLDVGSKPDAHFGQYTALDRDTLAVSAFREPDPSGAIAGAVYVFQRDHGGVGQWGLVKRLESDNVPKLARDFFGTQISMSDDRLIVLGNESATLYEFARNVGGQDNWGLVQKISVPQNNIYPFAFDGSTLVLRARNGCIPSEQVTNHLMFYERDQSGKWTLQQDIDTNLDVRSIAIEGDQLIAKSRDDTVGYLYQRNSGTWALTARLATSDDHGEQSPYGFVALDGGRALLADISLGDGVVFAFETAAPMNVGHSGAWYFPVTSGQGQFLEVEPDKQFVFLGWFTYTAENSGDANQQHWFTAEGYYDGSEAELDLYESVGGEFDSPQAVTTTRVGTVTLNFSDCGQGRMAYRFDDRDLSGGFPMARVIPGSDGLCETEGGSATQSVDVTPGMDGGWYDPVTSGQGFFFDVHAGSGSDKFIFVSWFTYGEDTASGQRWLTAEGDFEGSEAELVIYETNGGSFDDSKPVQSDPIGTMHIDFSDCNNAVLTYSLTDEGSEGSIEVTRVIPGSDGLCEELKNIQ